MPKIGLRTVKTAIAIFICAMIYVVLLMINEEFAKGWYTPFFAGLGTAYSIYPDKRSSLNQAKNRILASLFGGLYGIVIVLIYELITTSVFPNMNSNLDLLIRYTIVAICSIGVIQITLIFKQPATTFVAILTFLSVTINARAGLPVWQFGLNRIISTIVGVLVALGVNLFTIPGYKNRKLLFVIGLDGILKSDNLKLSGYYKYKMNNMLYSGARMTVLTTRTPTSLAPMMDGIKFRLPVICMNGACVFDIETKTYPFVQNMSLDVSNDIREFLNSEGITPFINIVKEDLLHIYNSHLDNDGEKSYFKERRNSSYCACLIADAPIKEITYFIVVIERKKVEMLMEKLKRLVIYKDIECKIYDYEKEDGYVFLKIYSALINELKAVEIVKNLTLCDKIVGVNTEADNHTLIKASDLVLTHLEPKDLSKETVISQEKNITNLFKRMSRIFHKKSV